MFDYESCTNADFDEFFPTWDSIAVKTRLFQATLALADAGIPMRDLVVACTAGMWPGEANNQRKSASEESNGICWFQRPFWKIRIHPCSMELDDCCRSPAFFCGKGFFRRFVDSGSLLHPRFVSQQSLRYWLLLLFFWSISQPESMSHWLLLAPSAKHNKIWWYD